MPEVHSIEEKSECDSESDKEEDLEVEDDLHQNEITYVCESEGKETLQRKTREEIIDDTIKELFEVERKQQELEKGKLMKKESFLG